MESRQTPQFSLSVRPLPTTPLQIPIVQISIKNVSPGKSYYLQVNNNNESLFSAPLKLHYHSCCCWCCCTRLRDSGWWVIFIKVKDQPQNGILIWNQTLASGKVHTLLKFISDFADPSSAAAAACLLLLKSDCSSDEDRLIGSRIVYIRIIAGVR